MADSPHSTRNGHHNANSPVVGSRAHELQLIYRYKKVFVEYQRVV